MSEDKPGTETPTADQALLALHDGILFMAEDLRQYLYCPRIVYFRHVLGIWPEKTYKMARGEEIHERKARRFDVKGEGRGETYFNVWLQSVALGFGALLDSFEYTGQEIYPVEIKTGKVPPGAEAGTTFPGHKIQLVVQAMLLEDAFNMPVTRAKVSYTDAKVDVFITVDLDDKRRVIRVLKRMREMVRLEAIPDATAHRGKCVDCEFWNHCVPG
jgi:CRISPR-associated exonuclease Cas4